MTSRRLSYQMTKGTFRIDDTHCGRVNLQVAVRFRDGHSRLYGQRTWEKRDTALLTHT